MPRLNNAQRNNAIDGLQAGESQTAVPAAMNVPQGTIFRTFGNGNVTSVPPVIVPNRVDPG